MLIRDSEPLQRVNFVNVALAWCSQIMKATYDTRAAETLEAYKNADGYYDTSGLFVFN